MDLTSLSVVLSSLWHDANVPITSIKAFAQLIAQSEEATPKIKGFSAEMLEACVQFQQISHSLRELFRANGLEEWTAIDLNAAVRGALDSAPPGGHRIQLSLASPSPLVLGEMTQVRALAQALVDRGRFLRPQGQSEPGNMRLASRQSQDGGAVLEFVDGTTWPAEEVAYLAQESFSCAALSAAPSIQSLALRAGTRRLHGKIGARVLDGGETEIALCFPPCRSPERKEEA